jgi:hypothetical protein
LFLSLAWDVSAFATIAPLCELQDFGFPPPQLIFARAKIRRGKEEALRRNSRRLCILASIALLELSLLTSASDFYF